LRGFTRHGTSNRWSSCGGQPGCRAPVAADRPRLLAPHQPFSPDARSHPGSPKSIRIRSRLASRRLLRATLLWRQPDCPTTHRYSGWKSGHLSVRVRPG
jgi:hypothetical protein